MIVPLLIGVPTGHEERMTKLTDAQLSALGAALEVFARRFKLTEAALPNGPLNEIDKQALIYVGNHPGCGPTDIARHLGIASTTMTSAADRLVKKGLLDRRRLENDRRTVSLFLTDIGKECVHTIVELHRDMYRRLLTPLSVTDRDHLIRIMTLAAKNEY